VRRTDTPARAIPRGSHQEPVFSRSRRTTPELVGRDPILAQARILLGRIRQKKPEKSILLTSLGPVRAKLIKKGMIYSPAHGELAFTVPLFDEFMIRAIPEFP
jgi:hypothetical protein